MGLSLEGFRGEFEMGKIAFELKDLKKDGGKNIRGIFCGEAQRKQEKSNCNQGRLSTFLDVLETYYLCLISPCIFVFLNI